MNKNKSGVETGVETMSPIFEASFPLAGQRRLVATVRTAETYAIQ